MFSTLSKSFYILWYDERTNVPFCQSVEDLDQEWLNQHAEIENLQWTQKVVFERRSPLPTRWYPGTCLSNSGVWSTKKWKVTIHILQNIDAKTKANCRNKQPLTNIVWFLKKITTSSLISLFTQWIIIRDYKAALSQNLTN